MNAAETKTLPRSTTIVSGNTTGRAAAPARRIQRGQPLMGERAGVVHAQDAWLGRPGRVRDGHLRQQQGRVHGLGRARAQHGGQDGAGGDVDGDSQLGPGQTPVVEEDQNI
ncbi:hypothetical protein [Streptomyces chrestomyceticus]|uniref:hypothetical protein n=1 Tax=Streptomyces chrestomyceticus TaxID=68185 RepID=UPI00142EFB94|nr:hypothetical protein [Streptomyces chrestomyceticus]